MFISLSVFISMSVITTVTPFTVIEIVCALANLLFIELFDLDDELKGALFVELLLDRVRFLAATMFALAEEVDDDDLNKC